MTQGNLAGILIRFSIPLVLSGILQQMYAWADAFIVGNLVGEDALAAVGATVSLYNLFVLVVTGLTLGVSILAAQMYGRGEREGLRPVLSTFAVVLGIAFLAVGLLGSLLAGPVLELMSTTEDTIAMSRQYLEVVLLGLPVVAVYNVYAAVLRGMGESRAPLYAVLVASLVNVGVDLLLVGPANMGVRGAALATVLSQLASCIYVLTFLFGKKVPIPISFGGYRPRLMGRILLTGLTPFLIIAVDNVMIIAMNAVLQRYGGAELGDRLITCATIAQSFMLVVTMPLGGISGGTQTILAFNYGARHKERILSAQKFITLLCVAYVTLLFILARVAGSLFVRLFTTEPSLAAEALDAIRVCTLAIIPLGVQYALVDGFTGMGQVQLSLPLSTFRKGVYFAALFLLPGMYGARAAFYAEPVSDILGPIVSVAVYALFIRRVLHFSQPERTETGPVLP